jgi:hypothetical protein
LSELTCPAEEDVSKNAMRKSPVPVRHSTVCVVHDSFSSERQYLPPA